MNIRDIGDICIVDMCKETISQKDVRNIKRIFKAKPSTRRLGFNMRNVRHVDSSFYAFIKQWNKERNTKIAFFNTELPVFLQFFTTGADILVNIYLDKADFCADKRVIVKRRLRLLKSA